MELTHFDNNGNAVMVDVSDKDITVRTATAKGTIKVGTQVIEAINNKTSKKGDVLGVARVAGIMAVKKTADLIPMCHPLLINKCSVDFVITKDTIEATCIVKISGKTGVEMEALTGISITLLTIYDMCKAIDKGMIIENIHLCEKTGGKNGDFVRK